MPKLTIAIDGPAGSGKSSVARRVAELLQYLYLDSGAMYRALALKALKRGIDNDEFRLANSQNAHRTEVARAPSTKLRVQRTVLLDGVDATREIRTPEAAQAASHVAAFQKVREVLVAKQRAAAQAAAS
jgi:cytidylate kinase